MCRSELDTIATNMRDDQYLCLVWTWNFGLFLIVVRFTSKVTDRTSLHFCAGLLRQKLPTKIDSIPVILLLHKIKA
jgi:hypothetical protein